MRFGIERNRCGHDGATTFLLGFFALLGFFGGRDFLSVSLMYSFTENLLARSGYLIPLIDFRSEWARRSGNLPSPGADELDPAPAMVVW